MIILVILGYVLGGVAMLIGIIGSYVNFQDFRLCKAEVELMMKSGLLHGEEEYMRVFRISRSGFDLEDSRKYFRLSVIILVIGVLIVCGIFILTH